jgi:hypothetical protein
MTHKELPLNKDARERVCNGEMYITGGAWLSDGSRAQETLVIVDGDDDICGAYVLFDSRYGVLIHDMVDRMGLNSPQCESAREQRAQCVGRIRKGLARTKCDDAEVFYMILLALLETRDDIEVERKDLDEGNVIPF